MNDSEKLKIAMQALQNIVSSIDKLERREPEGDNLNSIAAALYAENWMTYKNIVEEALREMEVN